jgi:hypothetical protein
MVEFEDGGRSIEIERDVFELHCFLVSCDPALWVAAAD